MAFIKEAVYFGLLLSLVAYFIGLYIKAKLKSSVFNPLLISIIIVIVVLVVGDIDYEVYKSQASILSWFLTPATIALAIPLYEKFDLLKKNFKAIMVGIVVGCLASASCIFLLALVFKFNHSEYITFLPKSITTAIGLSLSSEMGGNSTITAAIIIVTGVAGNVMAPTILKLAKITEPIAKGIAIGTSAHAIGTSKAMELGETEGAMSSLAIGVAGIVTVVLVSVFALFI